jgi:hypothetical protein
MEGKETKVEGRQPIGPGYQPVLGLLAEPKYRQRQEA